MGTFCEGHPRDGEPGRARRRHDDAHRNVLSRRDEMTAAKAFELWMSKARGASACDFTFHMGVTRYDDEAERELARDREARHQSASKSSSPTKARSASTTRSSITRSTWRRSSASSSPRIARTQTSSRSCRRSCSREGKTGPEWHHESRPPVVEAEGVHHLMTFAETDRRARLHRAH